MAQGNNKEFDAIIIGGAFSGTSAGVLLKRKHPEAKVLIVEQSEEFDRKVGESTSELAGCFLTKQLGLTSYLARKHVTKHGLRLWFHNEDDQCFSECSEVGGAYQSRLPTYQLDRSDLDQKLLDMAEEAGCEIWRPAKAKTIELKQQHPDRDHNRLSIRYNGEVYEVTSKWVIDATGKASRIPRMLGHHRKLEEHTTNAVWARFRNVRDLDDHELLEKFPCYAKSCKGPRSQATNHLMGYGWWCWLIPLNNGDLSAGLVYDSSIFEPEKFGNLTETLHRHLLTHPVGKVMFEDAEPVEKDTRTYSGLPYYSEEVTGEGWAAVGDAAGFIDPLYSQGLDYCAHTVCAVTNFISEDLKGNCIREQVEQYNREYPISYRRWYEALYKNKYHYLGDAEIMWGAFLLDIATYFIGPVRVVYDFPDKEFGLLPYHGKAGTFFAKLMALYNRRFVAIAKKRMRCGTYGASNKGKRFLLAKGFSPTLGTFSIMGQGIRHWLKLEVKNLFTFPKSTGKKEADPVFLEQTESQPST